MIPAGYCGCYLCPWMGTPRGLFLHAEEQHGKEAWAAAALELANRARFQELAKRLKERGK